MLNLLAGGWCCSFCGSERISSPESLKTLPQGLKPDVYFGAFNVGVKTPTYHSCPFKTAIVSQPVKPSVHLGAFNVGVKTPTYQSCPLKTTDPLKRRSLSSNRIFEQQSLALS
jgi:hypothetical protein